ncbi:hypothetical protein [Nitrobacter sp. JJSN]|uniref:hypothetical protein n=1 Tax=Nitrobacter sp. JJSN TaxID=3453033 RepID=UPI003F76098B
MAARAPAFPSVWERAFANKPTSCSWQKLERIGNKVESKLDRPPDKPSVAGALAQQRPEAARVGTCVGDLLAHAPRYFPTSATFNLGKVTLYSSRQIATYAVQLAQSGVAPHTYISLLCFVYQRGRMATWGVFEIGGVSYDLVHLDDRRTTVQTKDAEIGILVTFEDHCFTVDAGEGDTRPKFPGSTRKDGRFCTERHGASLDIWARLDHAMKGKVWLGHQDRCLVISADTGDDDIPNHYIIPFTLERHKGVEGIHLLMRVRSGFVRTPDRYVATFGEVRFSNLVDLALKGKLPKRVTSQNRKKPW